MINLPYQTIGHDHEETYDGPPPSIEEFAEQNHNYHASLNDESSSDGKTFKPLPLYAADII